MKTVMSWLRRLHRLRHLLYQLRRYLCRRFCRRFFPWQYNVKKRLEEGRRVVRLWEMDRVGRERAWARFEAEWDWQQENERLLGRRVTAWIRQKSELIYVEE